MVRSSWPSRIMSPGNASGFTARPRRVFASYSMASRRNCPATTSAPRCVPPTYYDPCSRVVLEALSYGVPCITTSFNGAAEVMTDGCEGFIIDTPDNVGLWARRIDELRAPELRRKMSDKAVLLRDKLSM